LGLPLKERDVLSSAVQVTGRVEQRKAERLVTLQPEVLGDAEHAIGNLLQRLRHATRQTDNRAAEGGRIQGALEELEGLLELIFDYVSPVDVEPRPVSASRVAESLAGQVGAHSPEQVTVGGLPAVQLTLDRRLLSRSFVLLGRAVGRRWERSSGTLIEAFLDQDLGRVEFVVRSALPAACEHSAAGHEQLALAVAGRLIEVQGGELHWIPSEGQVECRIVLPASRSGHAHE
jgi:hypothetical protein